MSRVMRARLGYFAGLLMLAVGVGLVLAMTVGVVVGLGAGLAVFGAGSAAAFVWLYNVDEPVEPEEEVRFR